MLTTQINPYLDGNFAPVREEITAETLPVIGELPPDLSGMFLEGATAEEIVEQYPSLKLADVYSVIGYYLRRKTEVDAYLKIRQERAAQARQENERRFNPIGIRDRLMARLNHQSLS